MKNGLFVSILLVGCTFANAQVGIGTVTPLSELEIQGSIGLAITTLTTSTTLNETHNVVLCKSGPYTPLAKRIVCATLVNGGILPRELKNG